MKLVEPSNKVLLSKLEEFDFNNPPTDPVKLANDLIEAMREGQSNGLRTIGLAANQLGLPYRVMVIEGTPAFVCFNPKIVDIAEEETKLIEGCVTFPHLWLQVKRPTWVRARFTDPYGITTTKLFTGMQARVFLHEFDHLEGRLYTWKVSPYELKKSRKLQERLKANASNPTSS